VGEGARGRGESAVKLEFGTNKRNVVLRIWYTGALRNKTNTLAEAFFGSDR
jgi:hypothetical protein